MTISDRPELRALLFIAVSLLLAFPLRAEEPAEGEDPASGAGPEAAWRAVARWDRVDEISTAEIHRHTTDPRYITPMVSYVPDHPEVPSPRDVLGYIAGAEGKLTHPAREHEYFEALAAASPRVDLEQMGLSEEGRRMLLVIVSAEANIARLERNRELMAELADPRRTDRQRAQEIAAEAKPVMHVTAGLHSPETGPPEMVMELAYRLAVSEHPDLREIRDNVILLITPVTEVDGRARVVEWYYRHLADWGDRFFMPSRSPPYWGVHAYHDNNRDGLQMTLQLTQHYNRAFHRWHPVYSLDLHESVPLLYVSTGTGPYNETVDPITVSEWQLAANWELTELNRQGLPGVWTWGFYTGWNPSYLLWVTNNHNSMGRFYETFGNGSAKTFERDLSDARDVAGKKVTSRQWYRASPPPEKLTWSLRNNTNYMQSGVLASLSLLARNRRSFLESFWEKGHNSLNRGRTRPPHAWVLPADQAAPDRLAYLLNQIRGHAIEVHRASADFAVDEGSFSQGDFVVRLDQPYGDFARNLLQVTKFPKEAEYRPYDDVSWTLGYLNRVDTRPIADPAILELEDLEPVTEAVSFDGGVEGKGRAFVVAHRGQNGLVSLHYRLRDFELHAAEESFEIDGQRFPAGSLLAPPQRGLGEALADAARDAMLDVLAIDELPEVARHAVDLPRLALYHNWVSTQPDGWVRYTLEQAGVEYEYINDDDVRAGDLRGRFDVILVAHQGGFGSLKAMVHGRDPATGPQRYLPEEGFESHGRIDGSEDITGGFGFEGLAHLEQFLDQDGTLILLGSSGVLATDSGLLRNVSSQRGVNTPGSAIQTKVVRRGHPVAYGYDDVNWVFRTNGPVYSVPEQYEHWVVVQYGTRPPKDDGPEEEGRGEGEGAAAASETEGETASEGEPSERAAASAEEETGEAARGASKPSVPKEFLLTGFVSGQQQLERKGVVLDVPRHRGGRVLLYSFNPLHRFLNHGDHNYLYNALLHWNDFPDPQPKHHPGLAKD